MISAKLLPLLRCPLSGQPLVIADQGVLDRLEALRAAGALRYRSGEAVSRTLEAGLIREDGTQFFPIVDNLPLLLPDEAIEIPAAK